MVSVMTLTGLLVMLATADGPRLSDHYQVLQRDKQDQAACVVALPVACPAGGTVEVTVRQQNEQASPVILSKQTLSPQPAGPGAPDGLLLKQIPVGGPYKVEVKVMDREGTVQGEKLWHDILVGDLWILAGQSNMEGVPPAEEKIAPLPTVNMLNLDNHWRAAENPLHRMFEAEAPAFVNLQKMNLSEAQILANRKTSKTVNPLGGTGPGLFFARELYKETNVPIGLIPCAYGGSSIAGWDPAGLAQGDKTLYGFMVERVRLAGGRVRGMLWYQGESDANPDQVTNPSYGEKLKNFTASVRRDFKDPDLPMLIAQIGCFIGYDGRYAKKGTLDEPYEVIREIQRNFCMREKNVGLVATVDLGHYDIIHLSYASQKRLGHRFATLALPCVKPGQAPNRGIELASARFLDAQRSAVVVEYRGVSGRLRSPGEAHGFELRDPQSGERLDWVYRIDFDQAQPNRLILRFDVGLKKGMQLYYAPRANSYVNIVDEKDMALPALGPVVIEEAQ